MIANQDDQSISLSIQPTPAPQQKKLSPLKDCEVKTNADHDRLSIFFTVNGVYVQNLISRKQRPNIPNAIKNKLGNNCIIFKEFAINGRESKLFYGQDIQINGNIHILYNSQLNVEFKVYFSKRIKKSDDFIWMFFNYRNYGNWKTKSFSLEDDQKGTTFSAKVPIDEFTEYCEPNVLITISVKKRQNSNTHQLGIINLGNTCYLNSCLQMLFYIRPLRRIILDSKSDNKIIRQLKEVFIMLMDTEEKKAVDVQNLLESYEKYNQLPRRQQDVQQFLLDFINEIEQQCPEVKSLWQGKCSQTTKSIEKDKIYNSVQEQEFAQLDVHLYDRKQNPYSKIEESLQDMMRQEQVEDMIDHDEFGKIRVVKFRNFLTLPDILFVNLKRYEWNKEKMRLSKIFSHIDYKENLNLGFIIGTPGNDAINPECDYTLFSVIVHKGTSPHNGHYFVFVNASQDCDRPQWISFNDSIVTRSDAEEILGFTGKKATQTILQKSVGRFVDKQIESDSSSYLLVYIRKAVFNEYQSIKTPIPKSYINDKIKKNAEKQKQSLHDVNVLMLDNFDDQIQIFDNSLEFMQIPMSKTGTVRAELKKVSKQLGSEAKYLYRVIANERKLKFIQSYESVSDIVSVRRGVQPATYVLALTEKIKQLGENSEKKHMGILHVSRNDLTELEVPSFSMATPKDLDKLEEMVNEKDGRLICIDSREDFNNFWNRYIEVEIYKNE